MKNCKLIKKTILFAICIYLPVASLAQAGSLDRSFGDSGIVTTSFGSSSGANGMAIQADGKIVMAGIGENNGNISFALTRYNTNGSIDNTFDTDGIVTTSIGECGSSANAIVIQADGKIVVAGYGADHNLEEPDCIDFFALTRYNTNGSLDTTFGIGGIVSTWIDPYYYIYYTDSRIYDIALQADGKIVAAGYFSYSGEERIALTRYNTNGSLDTTFGIGGIVTEFLYSVLEIEVHIAIQADGKIVAAGYLANGGEISPYHFWIVLTRFHSNGSLDSTFDTDGIVTTSIGTNSFAKDIAIQADGKILVAGAQTSSDSKYEFTVVRYNYLNASGLNTFSNQNTEINIYPNPTQNQININVPLKSLGSNYSVNDFTGKVVLEGKINSENTIIELANLPAGVYLLSVGDKLKQSFKVIKE